MLNLSVVLDFGPAQSQTVKGEFFSGHRLESCIFNAMILFIILLLFIRFIHVFQGSLCFIIVALSHYHSCQC